MSRRPLRRFVTLVALSAAALVTATSGGLAAARTIPHIVVQGGETQPAFSYTDAIREHVYVESTADSTGSGKHDRVNVDIVRPKETAAGLKVPVIMDESPYYDNAGRGNEHQKKTYDANGNPLQFPLFYDNFFVPRGYAYLAVDMIGTTRSDGCPTSGGRSDVLGGKAVVDWLNGRAKAFYADGTPAQADWSTGHVGMIGKSYDGTLANAVAATGVQGLDTIVPISAISSWYDYSRMNGVVYFTSEEDGLAQFVDTKPPAVCQPVRDKLAQGQDDATGSYNAFWDERNYRTGTVAQVGNVHASVFAVHGVNDMNVKPEQFSTWWEGLAQRGVPRKLWLHQYGHVDPFDFRRPVWVDTLHKWFDHWLYRIDNDVMKQPRVDLETGPDQWTTQHDWPAPSAHGVTLRPQADGSLGLAPAASGSTGTFGDTNGTSLGSGTAESDMVADPTTASPYRAAYVSQPLPFAVHLSGTPVVRLKAKADKPDANLTALLVDYGSDTRVNYLGAGEGITTLTTRDCWGDSVSYDSACYLQTKTDTVNAPVNVVARGWMNAAHRDSLSNPTPLVPGQYYDISWQTLPQDYIFKPGHRLALVLAGSDYDQNTVTPTGAQVTVDLSGTSITIPVVVSDAHAAFAPPQAKSSTLWRGPGNVHLPRPPRNFN